MIWDMWKQGFAAWEQATSQYMEKVLTNPGVLGPAGTMLTALKGKPVKGFPAPSRGIAYGRGAG